MPSDLSIEDLKRILHYDPETGDFTYLVDRGGIKAGAIAKAVDKDGYLQVKIFGVSYRQHRLAWFYMTGQWPEEQIDHEFGNRQDNRFAKLRLASNTMNARNQKKRSTNRSGVTGVCWHVRYLRWVSHIRVDGVQKFLGAFDDIFSAAASRRSAELKYGFHANHGRTGSLSR